MFVSVRMTKLRSICSIILYVIIGFDYWYVERFRLKASGELMLFNIKPLKFDVIIIIKNQHTIFELEYVIIDNP